MWQSSASPRTVTFVQSGGCIGSSRVGERRCWTKGEKSFNCERTVGKPSTKELQQTDLPLNATWLFMKRRNLYLVNGSQIFKQNIHMINRIGHSNWLGQKHLWAALTRNSHSVTFELSYSFLILNELPRIYFSCWQLFFPTISRESHKSKAWGN